MNESTISGCAVTDHNATFDGCALCEIERVRAQGFALDKATAALLREAEKERDDWKASAIAQAELSVERLNRACVLEAALREYLAVMAVYWERNGIEHDDDATDDECPQDDTCECPIVQRYLAAEQSARLALVAAPVEAHGAWDDVAVCPRCERGDHSAHGDPSRPPPNGRMWCGCGHNPGCPCGGCVAMRGDQPVREPPPERCAECHGEHFDMAGNRMPCPACGGRGSK